MTSIKWLLVATITFSTSPIVWSQTKEIGIVLMHGKSGSSSGHIGELATALQSKGYIVSTPTMPWSGNRIYDATFDEAMSEIDREIESLRKKGAQKVVVAGQSMGANAALGYGAARSGVDGIIVLAPGHTPELPASVRLFGGDVKRARELMASGKGKEKQRFSDINQGKMFTVVASAEVYLSWFDPEGPAVMPKSAASIKVPVPLLLIVGSKERFARGRDYIFDKAPPHPKSKFATVSADHFDVPSASVEEVVSWLASLQ